jgi:hypothetical protein
MRTTASIIISLAASGCAEPGQPPQTPGAVAEGHRAAMTSPSAPVVEVATYRSNGLTASGRLEGTLAIVDDCIMLQSPSHPDGALVFFPEGQARWNEADRSLTIGSERFRLGEKISLTGGPSNVSSYAGRANPPKKCPRSGGFFSGAKAIIVD